MPINPNIALSGQLNQPMNLMDMYKNALSIKRLNQENALGESQLNDQMTMRDVLKKNVIDDGNGGTTLNRQGALSDLYKVNPSKAMDLQKSFKDMDMEQLKAHASAAKELAWSAMPDGSNWGDIRQKAISLGLPNAEKLPENFSPGFAKQWQVATLDGSEQLRNKQHQDDMAQRAADRAESRKARVQEATMKADEKMQGLQTPFGLANTVDDAKQLKEAYESKKNFDNKIEQMIALREKHGGGAMLNREDVERGKQLSKDLLLEYKNMAKLGVLSKSDEDIINAIIPEDPLQYNSLLDAFQGQDPTLNRLKSFKSDSDNDFQNRVGTRTRSGLAETKRSINTGATNDKIREIGGVKYMKVDGGWLPANKVGSR